MQCILLEEIKRIIIRLETAKAVMHLYSKAILILILFLIACTDQILSPENPVKVAFIGDQGITENSRKVLELIRQEGADMVLHQGDFDYTDDPEAWDLMISDILGKNFPYFATVGNHDITMWQSYKRKLIERLYRIDGVSCSGEYGVNAVCEYRGLLFILSGVGTLGLDHALYIDRSLGGTRAIWKICTWHKNQHLMQVGLKEDETGWEVYETCLKHGAIIGTGHEHTYARTYLLSDITNQVVASTENPMVIKPGQTFVFGNGLGGYSIKPQIGEIASDSYWASIYTETQGANFGALFCTFGYGNRPENGLCYFKDIDGNVPDSFSLISDL
jgi:hypothetical protein